jgi:hypothetical protein
MLTTNLQKEGCTMLEIILDEEKENIRIGTEYNLNDWDMNLGNLHTLQNDLIEQLSIVNQLFKKKASKKSC